MQIELNRGSREPLYRQLASHLEQRIRSGALPSGTRLPTVRQLAQQLNVTRLTVHSAYAELQADGWIEATVGRGTFVAERIEGLVAPLQITLGREVSPAGLLNDMLTMTQIPGLSALARADPDLALFPLQAWQRSHEQALMNGGPQLMSYTTAQGDAQLRLQLAELARERGLSASPDEIMVTAGLTQGMAMVAELLARPGDAVLVEQPTYLGALNILARHGLRPIGLPMDNEGIELAAMEAAIIEQRPAYLYTIPTFQNPSGFSMSLARRKAVLELAERYQLPIVEDDIYGRLAFEGPVPPAIKSFDRHGLVIYLDSFSKNLMPGLRLGYLIAAPHLLRRLVQLRQAIDVCSPPITQRALAHFLEHGQLQSHIRRVLPRYRERRDTMLKTLERFMPHDVHWTRPQGGFACWLELPASISVTDLYMSAIARGVAFAPGEVFKAHPDGRANLRLCFAAEHPDRLTDAITILASLIRERSRNPQMSAPNIRDYVPVV